MSKFLKLAEIISFIPGQNYMLQRQFGRPTDFETWSGSKPGYLALYSYKYKAEKPFSYFCFNLKPRQVAIRSRDVYWSTLRAVYVYIIGGVTHSANQACNYNQNQIHKKVKEITASNVFTKHSGQ